TQTNFELLHLFSAMRNLLIISVFLNFSTSFKFLAYSPIFAKSHVNFMAKITDVLVDAGHEVVMLSEVYDTHLGGSMTNKARVIEIPQTERAKEFEKWINNDVAVDFWADKSLYSIFSSFGGVVDVYADTCIATLTTPGLLDALRAEKFDAAYVESFHGCAPIVFHLLGIDKFAMTESLAMNDAWFHYTQTPSNPSYVPSMMFAPAGENMTFFERVHNTYVFALNQHFTSKNMARFEEIVRERFPHLPPFSDLTARNSLVFTNSEPLVDFPRPTTARMVEIGGIVVSSKHEPVNKTWSTILDLRPRTIFLSFGSVAKAHLMPEEYKRSIVEVIKRFPDVTFIWKYERPDHNISRGIDNLIESTWVPQRDLLHDPRLTAFITHCGQGSTTEAIDAGIPLVVIPVLADQYRNARQVVRNGIGLMLEKSQLSTPDALEAAIREILSNNKYRERAYQVRKMINERPFPMKEVFIRNMEFLAAHGTLRQLDHYGRHLNFVQYFLIDVFSFVSIGALFLVCIMLLIFRSVVLVLSGAIRIKAKVE
ncbi:hypothetical protein PMAYCL1PPCAC_27555, partial [Pristionchus mayeri]